MSNRLAQEKSPYLLQHKDNPVDWYPWGEEAFEKARREAKPVFLSIGYSTCHWCHVMEEESFENPAVAQVMNENFVSIKVDREERPDLDNIYMTAVQALAGTGGWPLSVFLTPEKKPFFGGTYWPPEDRWGRPGFISVLNSIREAWKTNRPALLKQSQDLVRSLERRAASQAGGTFNLSEETLRAAARDLRTAFDETHGGFGQGIKFPRSHTLSFLLRFWKRTGEKETLAMVERTLTEMAQGGMWDLLGGGFHRYSTDSRWFLPHFEKMLYDQALLSKTYLEAYQVTKREEYSKVVREIFDYVLRDLRGPEGAFYSAEDADSLDPKAGRKREGAFYVWEHSEILEILGERDGALFNRIYGVLPGGNVEKDPQGEFPKKNVLSLTKNAEEAVLEFKRPAAEVEKILEASRKKLFEARADGSGLPDQAASRRLSELVRAKRTRPHRDDKILTDWNGLMISSLAFGSLVLEEPRYSQAAREAADFILEKLVRKDGRLLHRWRDGEAAIPGTVEDYAFFIHGLFDLYEATFEVRYLAEARRLSEEMLRLFWDDKAGGFFFTAGDREKLIVRQKEIYDGAIPSGNSVAALDLLRVGRLTMAKELEKKAELLFDAFSNQIKENPEAYPQMLIAFDFALGPSREIVIAGDESAGGTQKLIEAVYNRFFPNQVVALHPAEMGRKTAIEKLVPFMAHQLPLDGQPTAYLCQNYVCKFPTTEPAQFENLLDGKG